MATKVGDVLYDKLTGAGVPAKLATQLGAAKQYVAQGVTPPTPGASAAIARATATGSPLAFMSGFTTSLVIGAIVTLVAAFGALLVRRGETATDGVHAGV
jgi:hypothetical protein